MATFLLPFTPKVEHDANKHVWTPDTGPKLPASLLSRLTEAADGHRDGQVSWLVGKLKRKYKKGYKIKGPYKDQEVAYEKNRDLFDDQEPTNDLAKIFGPFLTYEDFGEKESQVEYVTLHLKGGDVVKLDGAKYDCVFWSLSAVDKFVVPYYVQIANLEEAEEVRDHFLDDGTIAAIHIPGSDIIDDAPSGASASQAPEGEKEDVVGLNMLTWKPGGNNVVALTPA